MSDRPILFSGPMVRALLAGRKTQTRRLSKPQPHLMSDKGLSYIGTDGKGHEPRIRVGDRLWVKETWGVGSRPDPFVGSVDGIEYKADEYGLDEHSSLPLHQVAVPDDVCLGDLAGRWRSSIHMFRWASRITLTVTDVRVQRLQDISEEDADAECFGGDYPSDVLPEVFPGNRDQYGHLSIAQCYGRLWDHINGPGSWDANPWIVAYSFTVRHGNIDEAQP